MVGSSPLSLSQPLRVKTTIQPRVNGQVQRTSFILHTQRSKRLPVATRPIAVLDVVAYTMRIKP